jgi:hypothetical protein
MSKLWQLKKLSSGEALNEPQRLPENWGPIFGMQGFIDRIGNLSWLGEGYNDQGWVQVEVADVDTSLTLNEQKEVINAMVKKLLDDGFVIESTLNLGEIESRLVEDYLTENRMMKSGDFELVRGGIYSSV